MLDIIANNPFRVLGVYSSAKQTEILKNANKMKAYLNVGKEISFPTDMNYLFPQICRTVELAVKAQNDINLPVDKIRYALFWFCTATPVDDIALNNLVAENLAKALEIFEKKSSFASILNLAVLSIVQKQYSTAVSLYTLLVRTSEYKGKFLSVVCGDTFHISEDELMHIIIDELLKVEKPLSLVNYMCNAEDKTYVRDKALSEPIAKINTEIAKANSVSKSDADASLKAGKALIRNTKMALNTVKDLAGTTSAQYQSIADNLAKQILQCGINYFNNSDDDDNVDKALEIQQYALNIAVGKMVKDRCKQNVDVLLDQKKHAAYKEDLDVISAELESFQNALPSIARATDLVNKCKPHLAKIKSHLGSTDEFYLSISSAVANNALGMLIDVVNEAQDSSTLAVNVTSGILTQVLDSAVYAMNIIGKLDMNNQERSRFDTNRRALSKLKSQLDSVTHLRSCPSSSSSSSSPEEPNMGCIIAFIIVVIVFVICLIIDVNS